MMNRALAEAGLPWAVYGTFSGFHLFTNPEKRAVKPEDFDPHSVDTRELVQSDPGLLARLRLGMLVHGVDINGRFSGLASATHGPDEMAATVEAFRRTLKKLRDDGELS
jgi:glutamate-1-semialdehyde 2,1-aminomutase